MKLAFCRVKNKYHPASGFGIAGNLLILYQTPQKSPSLNPALLNWYN